MENEREQIKTSVGQVVSKMTVVVDGVCTPVVPVQIAAARLGYSLSHTRFLCNSLQLTAIKIAGLWFVHELETETPSQTIRRHDAS